MKKVILISFSLMFSSTCDSDVLRFRWLSFLLFLNNYQLAEKLVGAYYSMSHNDFNEAILYLYAETPPKRITEHRIHVKPEIYATVYYATSILSDVVSTIKPELFYDQFTNFQAVQNDLLSSDSFTSAFDCLFTKQSVTQTRVTHLTNASSSFRGFAPPPDAPSARG